MEFRTLFHGSVGSGSDAGGLFLIGPERWAGLWRGLHHGQGKVPERPDVDFGRETVVQLGIGTRPVLGYDVTISDLAIEDGTLVVTATETRHVGIGLTAICAPAHVVAVEFGDRPVERLLLQLLIQPLEGGEG